MAKTKFKNPVVNWIDHRLGIFTFMNHELNEYPTPKNLNFVNTKSLEKINYQQLKKKLNY